MATSSTSASLGGTPQAVEFGAAMRDMRLAHNADLATVATNLRIRQVYLQAIEDGRFDDLPGPTYASGFVRAYAEYLGLDLGEVMRRYRDVTRGGGTQAPLVAPAPVSEGRMPTGFILLVAAVLAAIAYGSWYYLTLHDRDAGEIVARLPQRIADMVGLNPSGDSTATPAPAPTRSPEPPASGSPTPAPPVTAEAPPPLASAPRNPAPSAESAAPAVSFPEAPPEPSPSSTRSAAREDSTAETPPPAPSETAPAQESPAEPAMAAESVPPVGDAAAPAPSSETAGTAMEGSAETPAEPPASTAQPTPEPVAEPTPQPAPETAVTAAPAAPAVAPSSAPQSDAGRVVLRATAISWVELRDADGNRVFSRLLKKGETYNVPPQPGITLATGNAGALDILVDGQAIGPIGPVGAVRRDVLLEPEALRRRTPSAQ